MAAPSFATVGCDTHSVRLGSECGLSLDWLFHGQPVLPRRWGGIADRWGDECRGRSLQKEGGECVLRVVQPPADPPISEPHRKFTDREQTCGKPRGGI